MGYRIVNDRLNPDLHAIEFDTTREAENAFEMQDAGTRVWYDCERRMYFSFAFEVEQMVAEIERLKRGGYLNLT